MKVDETPCPGCGALTLSIVTRFFPLPDFTYSIAGVAPKTVGNMVPVLVCGTCGISAQAKP